MSTVVVGEQDWMTEFLQRRRELGQDGHDEVWDGVYHMAPNAGLEHAHVAAEIIAELRPVSRRLGLTFLTTFNLGEPGDFRVPDGGWVLPGLRGVYTPTARAILEVLSPGDETYAKFDFYARHDVQELIVADPLERWIQCYAREGDGYGQSVASDLFGVTVADLTAAIRWP